MNFSSVSSPSPVSRRESLRLFTRDLLDTLRGKEHDYTSGNITRAIALLAVPMVLEMMMESIFAVVDIFFVAKLGPEEVATVGLTESVLTLIFAVAIGLSMATTAMVARRIGEKQQTAARIAAFQAIFLGIAISLPIGLAGILFAPEILGLMGASAEVIRIGSLNTAVMLGGNVTIILIFLINAIFRGAGDPVIAMKVLLLSNGINIVLDPCLIFGLGPLPELGVTGAAVATTTGRGIGVLYQIYVLTRGNSTIQIKPKHMRLDLQVIWRLIRVSIGGILQWLIATTSWIVLVRIVAVFGSAALAGYTIGLRIIVFAILPSWGLSNAVATLVGQNLGAGKPARAERSVWLTGLYNMLFLGSIALVFIFYSSALVGIFTDDPLILTHAIHCLRYISYGYVFFALGMVISQAFNGAGDTFTPTAINFFCYWLLQIPLAYVLALPLGLKPVGVFIAIAVAESLLALVSAWIFRKGKWKQQQI